MNQPFTDKRGFIEAFRNVLIEDGIKPGPARDMAETVWWRLGRAGLAEKDTGTVVRPVFGQTR